MHIGTQGLCDYEAPGSTKVKRTRRERASVSERERESDSARETCIGYSYHM